MDLYDFEKWAYKEFNIDLSAYKSNQLHRRIQSLILRAGVNSVEDYIKLLKTSNEQRKKFLDFITINVTEFFRNPEIFNELSSLFKEDLTFNKRILKIWSAACSNGAEPYSIAMILQNITPNVNHKIYATDIDETILSKAKKGEYTNDELKNVDRNFLNKYFKKLDDKYVIDNKIKNMVYFKKHDLILDDYDNNLDLIVCRNVMIYFKPEVKEKIYNKFSKSLKKGGYLFVGASESIYNYKNFGFEKYSTFIYKRV